MEQHLNGLSRERSAGFTRRESEQRVPLSGDRILLYDLEVFLAARGGGEIAVDGLFGFRAGLAVVEGSQTLDGLHDAFVGLRRFISEGRDGQEKQTDEGKRSMEMDGWNRGYLFSRVRNSEGHRFWHRFRREVRTLFAA